MKLMKSCLSPGKVRESTFIRRGGPGKLVEAGLGGRKDRESSFHNGGGPVKLVQASLSTSFPCARKIGGSAWYTLFAHARLPRFFWGTWKLP